MFQIIDTLKIEYKAHGYKVTSPVQCIIYSLNYDVYCVAYSKVLIICGRKSECLLSHSFCLLQTNDPLINTEDDDKLMLNTDLSLRRNNIGKCSN